MIVNVVGVRRGIDFKSSDGKVISGISVFITYPDPLHGVEGVKCERQFINSNYDTSYIKVPCKIDIEYDRNGRLVNVRPCDK